MTASSIRDYYIKTGLLVATGDPDVTPRPERTPHHICAVCGQGFFAVRDLGMHDLKKHGGQRWTEPEETS